MESFLKKGKYRCCKPKHNYLDVARTLNHLFFYISARDALEPSAKRDEDSGDTSSGLKEKLLRIVDKYLDGLKAELLPKFERRVVCAVPGRCLFVHSSYSPTFLGGFSNALLRWFGG